VIQLATKTASGGVASDPSDGDSDVSVKRPVPAVGAARSYPSWHRNSPSFCTTPTFHLTNGVRTVWLAGYGRTADSRRRYVCATDRDALSA